MVSSPRVFFYFVMTSASVAFLAAPANGISLASDTQASGTQASGTQASGTQASGTQASDTQASGTQASDTQASGTQASTTTGRSTSETIAQITLPPSLPPDSIPSEPVPPADVVPDLDPGEQLPDRPLPQLPPVDELLGDPESPNTPEGITGGSEETFEISGIELVGSSIFTSDDFATLFEAYIGRPITFSELLQLRSAVTQRYVEEGFLTTGAFIPPQTLEGGVVTVQVLEGVIEEIEIVGTQRLNPDYIRSRLGLAAQPPINADTLLEGLQRLQIDPLVETVSADLQAGVRPGTSILRVEVTEADSFEVSTTIDNGRSPNVGSLSRELSVSEGNLFGIGDRIALSYSNTDGSNNLDLSYSIPVSPYNTRLNFQAGIGESRIIGEPFDVLEISSDAFQYSVGVEHPLIETPTEDFTLGLALSHKETQTRLGIQDFGAFPLSPGADSDGETRVSALQFTQQWTKRSPQQVFAARSQFNLGLDILNASRSENAVNDPGTAPDSQFFSWRGQGQWVRLLGEDALFFLRSDVQLASDSLLSAEQFGLGGQQTVRGYRQNALLRDNGALVSAEARFPIVRFAENSIVQITPFVDAGVAWNHRDNDFSNNFLAGTGFGFLWEQNDNFSARLDWGIPLVDLDDGDSNTLQDSGIYFSVRYNLF
ncbi:MAG: ShlB/FhaC/HecB family hemolysin secretion/activation protein [Cyanobacteria bacterium J06634_6]